MPEDRLLRRTALMAVLLLVAMLAALLAVDGGLRAQEEGEEAPPAEEEAPAVAVAELTRQERLGTLDWELQVDDLVRYRSVDRPGYDEVRVALTMRNVGQLPILYRVDGFFTDRLYPRLALRDAAEVIHPYTLADGTEAALPQAFLRAIPPGLTGRWTVGFEVPSVDAGDLDLLVTAGDFLAVFDMASPLNTDGWQPPAADVTARLGETVPWGPTMEVTFVDSGNLLCGEPSEQLVTHIFALGAEVRNVTPVDVDWPGVRIPADAGIAQWEDGTSGRATSETFWGPTEQWDKWAADAVTLPPGDDPYRRALIFAAPRDDRLSDAGAPPRGVLLTAPDDSRVWLELDGLGGIAMNPLLCDADDADAPIPFAFAGGARFLDDLTDLDAAELDAAATRLLGEAGVLALRLLDVRGTFEGVTADDLAELWDGIAWVTGFANSGQGFVSVDTRVEGVETDVETVLILTTRSISGTYFCTDITPAGDVVTQSAPTFDEAATACLQLSEEEAPLEAQPVDLALDPQTGQLIVVPAEPDTTG